ncbi:AraC family transcriptional regulator [Affinirhizobium pseudoryzae]|uniref:AraC family transcriptional regulator n=1 Tax=Allorhizobium pseudoryzae TaxID=379684 RepID=UPI0013E9ACFE|nr:helix-turn-helix transcriptional regulator [Allorhizobium pseudoryzae]
MPQAIRLPGVRILQLEPALQQRTLALSGQPLRWMTHVLLLRSGRATLSFDGEELRMEAPALVLMPPAEHRRLTVQAGARGDLLSASGEQLSSALGDEPETPALRTTLSSLTLAPDIERPLLTRLETLVSLLADEQDEDRPASNMATDALLRLLCLSLWRVAGRFDANPGVNGDGLTILQRFRQVVEAEFRRHRPIRYYAERLGITTDRLHAIATRHLQRSPLDLVHDRLLQEALQRLERSPASIQAISDSLNFKDPAHFSRFVKRRTGQAPAQYRLSLRKTAEQPASAPQFQYHEWP